MTAAEALALVKRLMAAYPRTPMPPETVQVYCEMMADMPHGAAKRAVLAVCASSKWLPTIAEIRAHAAAETLEALPEPAEAWGEVLRQVRQCGRYRQPSWSSSELADAVAAIGWEAICMSRVDDAAIRAQFREAYAAGLRRAETAARLPAAALTARGRERKARLESGASVLKRLVGAIGGDDD